MENLEGRNVILGKKKIKVQFFLSWQRDAILYVAVAMDETLDTFIDSYLHFRRRWYDGKTFSSNSSQTAGIIVGDGDLSRRVFMLLYRM